MDGDNRNNFKEDAGGSGIPVTCAILPSDKHQIAANDIEQLGK
jgi:hypothetical protein